MGVGRRYIIPNMTTKAESQSALAHLAYSQQHQGEMLSLLRHMVEIESPSDDKAAVDRMGAFLGQVFERLGGKVTFYPQQEAGNHLKAEFSGGASDEASDRASNRTSGKPVLLL